MSREQLRFWPQDPGQELDGPQPEDLLRAAASELGPATKFEVVAELDTTTSGGMLEHQFYLVSEKVGYRYLLFRACHQLGFPVTIFDVPFDVFGETKSDDPFEFASGGRKTECESVEQTLKHLFEHPTTQRIVGQLRNLSREAG